MKTLFVFILGLAIGAAAMHFYRQDRPVASTASSATHDAAASAREATHDAVAKTRAAASDLSDAIGAKMREWRLTPEDVRAEIGKGGEVVRKNASRAGSRVADARIVAVIKAKFVLDRELSATAINVDSTDGHVTLTGTVASETHIGKATAVALDTDGVAEVKARLTVAQ